ncbi:hypothetical protein HPB48_016701 [Haemaphysalis longicornis]|uniref:Uncharacterized protein n=1 Tax=Haemaphysalis longicornis TaxID=44386 RepID=A0A9J6GPP5_HAELO|nr:hypothetical protein HPB48_016701 [Haemaphysalis longicornis]
MLRPQGGLNITKAGSPAISAAILAAANISTNDSMGYTICPNVQQNIAVPSAPKNANALCYAASRTIIVQANRDGRNANETSYGSTRGVVHCIPIKDSQRDIENNILNPSNHSTLGAKRIGTMTTVIVAFSGHKVLNYIRYGAALIPWHLYRKQIDMSPMRPVRSS